uniref:COX15/CtaA family protein n=1 Tax=uncultured Sphingomonas sp. TaxID=158754 RepID=UPI0035CC2CA6
MLQASSRPSTVRPRTLATWLWIVAALIVAIVVIGGITRLTESGLSITQWKPLSGTIPPLTDAQWQAEFANYRRIPQYEAFNHGMTLAGFKAIFFWEYLHRSLGRVIGLAYLLPLLWFALRRQIPRGYLLRLIALFLLIALQGTFGWLMVRSGLSGRTEVAPGWLATHLITALFTLAGMAWTALDLRALANDRSARPARLRLIPAIALALLFAQILFGALTAGLRAGYAFSSWPLMGDEIFPAATPLTDPLWRNVFDNPIVVQFAHRWWAFVVAAGLMMLAARARRAGAPRAGLAVIALVCAQIVLGIVTLLSGVEIVVAVGHQANAALLLIAATVAAHAVGRRPA